MNQQPVLREIKRSEQGVSLTWNDGTSQFIKSEILRRNCPCAGCREARGDSSHAQPLTPKKSMLKVIDASAEEQTSLTRVWAVGNYAVGMEWKDGHSTGIYSYGYLKELGDSR